MDRELSVWKAEFGGGLVPEDGLKAIEGVRLLADGRSLRCSPHRWIPLLPWFRREARAAANLCSPHTIQLYDFGVASDGTFYYVMELLNGMDQRLPGVLGITGGNRRMMTAIHDTPAGVPTP